MGIATVHGLSAVLLRGAVLVALWWLLTGGQDGIWIVGSATVALSLALSLKLAPPSAARFSLVGLIGFLGFFLLGSVQGGVQVALIALRPRLDLRPDVLDIPVRLPEGTAQVLLIGTLGLLPGTLAITLDAGRLRLHVLDRRLPAEHEVREAEKWIARLLRLELR